METKNIYCDFCNKRTTDDGVKKENVSGFSLESKVSSGGWGNARTLLNVPPVEICDDCHEKVRLAVQNVRNVIEKLKQKK